MKLNRREKKRENDNLDLFLSFAPKFVKNLQQGKGGDLTEEMSETFRHVYNFLERDFTNRRVTGARPASAKVKRAQEMFRKEPNIQKIMKELNISKATVYRYLEAEEVAAKKAAKDAAVKQRYDEEIEIFRRFGDAASGDEITAEQIKQIKKGLAIVKKSREVAQTRSANLAAGRDKFKE